MPALTSKMKEKALESPDQVISYPYVIVMFAIEVQNLYNFKFTYQIRCSHTSTHT